MVDLSVCASKRPFANARVFVCMGMGHSFILSLDALEGNKGRKS